MGHSRVWLIRGMAYWRDDCIAKYQQIQIFCDFFPKSIINWHQTLADFLLTLPNLVLCSQKISTKSIFLWFFCRVIIDFDWLKLTFNLCRTSKWLKIDFLQFLATFPWLPPTFIQLSFFTEAQHWAYYPSWACAWKSIIFFCTFNNTT